ncbi:outer membrane protein assembly factor BamE domain-containing protein [Paenibacillus paridis]|uniref:outer membrane protein assembly factor BamE domain-containing protein n=1 Tax=Paenibacillus paridis TaxID=2583376 RepID=UPI0013912C75|nr:outer membrane protein assembly factor BamE [Paenibacillus paridis]
MWMNSKFERNFGHGRRALFLATSMVQFIILSTIAISNPLHVNAATSITNVVNGNVIQHPYLTIQVIKQGNPISIQPGMSKQQVDKLLGTPVEVESSSFKGYSYSSAMVFVGYIDGKAASIFTSTNKASLNGQFKIGTPWKKVLAKLGQPSQKNDYRYDYVFQIINGKLKQIYGKSIALGKGKSDVYTLRFVENTNGNISGITVEQSAFTQSMEDRLTKPDPNKPTFAIEEIIGIRSGDGKRISLGMKRETVEEQYGKPDGHFSYGMAVMDTYGTISIFYRDEIVAAILVDSSADIQTNKGLKMPASRNEVLRSYGEPTFNESGSLDYNFEQVGTRLQAMNMFKSTDRIFHFNEKYSLTFVADEDDPNQMDYFILNDFDFIYDEMNLPKPTS